MLLFKLAIVVLITFDSGTTPVPFGEAQKAGTFASVADCEAQGRIDGPKVAAIIAGALKKTDAPATVTGFEVKCESAGVAI